MESKPGVFKRRWLQRLPEWRHPQNDGALHKVGAIDRRTMRRFDNTCLTRVRARRERGHVSQTVFANYLKVTPNLVSKWERGQKRPSGPALKLLSLVEKHGIAGGRLKPELRSRTRAQIRKLLYAADAFLTEWAQNGSIGLNEV